MYHCGSKDNDRYFQNVLNEIDICAGGANDSLIYRNSARSTPRLNNNKTFFKITLHKTCAPHARPNGWQLSCGVENYKPCNQRNEPHVYVCAIKITCVSCHDFCTLLQPSAWVPGYVIVPLVYKTFCKTIFAHTIKTLIFLSTGSAAPRFFLCSSKTILVNTENL
jgi:hypothetical protein